MDVNILSRVESVYPLIDPSKSGQGLDADAAAAEAAAAPRPASALRGIEAVAAASALRGFALGYGGYATLTVLGVALRERLWRRAAAVVFESGRAREGARYGAFLAAALASYNGVMHATRGVDPRTALGRYRGALAGLVGGASLGIAPTAFSRPATLLLSVRALEVGARNLVRRGVVPRLPHADAALMAAASARVMWCWIFCPRALDPGYLRFIMRIGGVTREQLDALATVLRGERLGAELLERLNAALPAGQPPVRADAWRHRGAEARVLHNAPSVSSAAFLARYWLGALGRSMRMYLPVYAAPAVLLRAPEALRDPAGWAARTAPEVVTGAARSALFLGSFCATGWAAVLGFAAAGANARALGGKGGEAFHGSVSGAACGLAVVLEKRSRRVELALFVLSHALRSCWRGAPLRRREKDRVEAFVTVPLGMLAVACMCHAYVRHPDDVRRSYAKIMRRLMDNGTGGQQKRKLLWPLVSAKPEKGVKDGKDVKDVKLAPVPQTDRLLRLIPRDGSNASFGDWNEEHAGAARPASPRTTSRLAEEGPPPPRAGAGVIDGGLASADGEAPAE